MLIAYKVQQEDGNSQKDGLMKQKTGQITEHENIGRNSNIKTSQQT